MTSYSLYYMFDTDTKTFAYFGTHDTFIDRGEYTGEFSSGVTLVWDHGEWTDTFAHIEGENNATYFDPNGFEWEYTVSDIASAQRILNELEQ